MAKIFMMALVATMAFSSSVKAYDGNKLLENCTSEISAARGACIGYANAVADYSGIHGDICVPNGVKWGQTRDIVVQALLKHPEARHASAILLTMAALLEAFPCPKKQ